MIHERRLHSMRIIELTGGNENNDQRNPTYVGTYVGNLITIYSLKLIFQTQNNT